jgi:predicted SAM-dependent methyltransferase
MIKINLGCGWRNFGKDWHHIDGGDYEHLDSNDIFNLPFNDNSVDLVYASHIIEYFDRHQISDIIKLWYNKLKPSGVLRLAVPDFEVISRLYQTNECTLDNFLGPLYGKMQMNGDAIYHKTVYDYKSLSELLHNSKFNSIRRWDWRNTEHTHYDDHSQAYWPHMDKENGTLISLNIEAIK